ncbi:hypothetical protein GCM10022396_00860 [Flavivirga amylovorans]|uniref:hypothetical protein n=1 Tax=Flavivirga rizhaonensis TaxID=2559571 RepID=UPI0014774CC1|nr:hypothetical protein [Flavivirga rizhaonensis]
MGKKKKKKAIKKLQQIGIITTDKVKTSCCKKFKKGENKRCKKCPCFDLLKKVA